MLLTIACQPPNAPMPEVTPSPTNSSSVPSGTPSDTSSPQADLNQYENQSAGFQFAYPKDFVLDDGRADATRDTSQPVATPPEGVAQLNLELWQQEKYQAILSGAYAGGTELPPNVQVSVYPNADRLPLKEWVSSLEQQFTLPRDFQNRSIAGQEGFAFQSTGLYEHKNVALPSQAGNEVIVISLATVGVAEVDEPNQRAFDQIVSTFAFIAQ